MIDLGYGTTWTYMGHREPENAIVVKRYDGKLIPVAERQVVALSLALRHGNREAGYRMGVAEKTVKNMLRPLYRRLGVFSKWEAADLLGWVHIPQEVLDASLEAAGRDNPARASGGRLGGTSHSAGVAGAAPATNTGGNR